MIPRRAMARAVGLAIALTAVACELTIGLDPYQAGCASDTKACPDAVTHVVKCVPVSDPDYGCTPTDCQSCTEAATPHIAPSQYQCSPTGNSCSPTGSTCPVPWQHCDTVHPYCESNSQMDDNNCGGCGMSFSCVATGVPPNAMALAKCVGGLCRVVTCAPNWADCDGSSENGCETALTPDNCYSCQQKGGAGVDAGGPCCKECYAGASGFPNVCPACKATGVCTATPGGPYPMACQ